MAIQSLERFRSTFSTEVVSLEVDKVSEFTKALEKVLSGGEENKRQEAVEMFGAETIGVCERIAKEGHRVHLRPLKSYERDEFESSVVGVDSKRDLRNLRARLVSIVWQYADGSKVGDAKKVGNLGANFMGILFDEVRKLNGMDMDDENEGELGKE